MTYANDLEQFYHLFPDPQLAKDLMNILEDFRIDTRLKQEYPALGEHMGRIHEFLITKRPALGDLSGDTQRIVEVIGQTLTSGKSNESVPSHLETVVNFAVFISTPLTTKDADIHQVARITAALYFYIDEFCMDPYQPVVPFSIGLDPSTYRQYVENLKNAEKSKQKKQGLQKESDSKHKQPGPPIKGSKEANHPKQSSLNKEPVKSENNQDLSKIPEVNAVYQDDKNQQEGQQHNSIRPLFKKNGRRIEDVTPAWDHAEPNKSDDLMNFFPFRLYGKAALEAMPGTYLYPEWGDDIGCYRSNWARVREHRLADRSNRFYLATLQKYAGLIKRVKREFQMLKPEGLIKFKRQYDGDEIDLDSTVDYLIDRRMGKSPSEKNYIRTKKNDRDIAVSFLIDMSGSTRGKTIELEKEALVIMSEALSELGDAFSIFGFSGYTRQNVAFYIVKDFSEAYDQTIAGRISAIKDKHSTRIGPALRHAAEKLRKREEKIKLLILLSDGKPEDREYDDAYGIEDTRSALKEGQKHGIRPFCITVDSKAPEYLYRMYSHSNWVIVNDVTKLPMKITRIYKRLTSP